MPERDAFADDESIDPRWVSFLVAKPALVDPSMPRWVRWLAPLLSGVFTVDNLDYVRRDAYLTGVAAGPVDVERLRRYTFVSERGLTLYEPGLGALEMFLTARRFMYQQVYFHRTVRAIDLDLAEVFGPSVRAHLRRRLPGRPAGRLRRPRRVRAAPPGGALGPRGTRTSTQVGPASRRAAGGRSCCASRRWRAEAEVRAEYEAGDYPDGAHREPRRRRSRAGWRSTWPSSTPGRRTPDSTDALLAPRAPGRMQPARSPRRSARIPAYWLIGRRYRRRAG